LGGTLLASATYAEVGGQWGGADLGPVSLVGGQQYLVGFTNVESLGVSYTEDPGSTLFSADGTVRYDTDSSLPVSYENIYVGQANAIIRIYGIPEPTTLALISVFAFIATCRRGR
jgi:hypothetical protein